MRLSQALTTANPHLHGNGVDAVTGKSPHEFASEGAGLVGGPGLAPGLCAGEHHAMAQATHGSAPDIASEGIANPYAMIMSGKMLFEWLSRKRKEPKAAERIDRTMERVIAAAKALTPDLDGKASTSEMGDAIVAAL